MTDKPQTPMNPEERIARVLTALRNVEAAPGLERRILQAAEQRAALLPAPRPSQRRRWTFAAAAFAAVCLIVIAVHQGRQQSTPVTTSRPTQQASLTAAAPVEATPDRTLPPPRRARQVSPAKTGSIATTRRSRPSDVTHAVSFPAPPLPLTDQEKLLLRLVHKGDPVEIAMLIPETRARQQAEGKAEFQRFFDLPTQEKTSDQRP